MCTSSNWGDMLVATVMGVCMVAREAPTSRLTLTTPRARLGVDRTAPFFQAKARSAHRPRDSDV